MSATTTQCRRCTECVGEAHHWLEGAEMDGEDEDWVGWICKHCLATSEMCTDCGGPEAVCLARGACDEADE